MRALLVALVALSTQLQAARRYHLAPTAQGDGTGRNPANARAFDGQDINQRLLNDPSDPEVELRFAPGVYAVRTAINVGGGTLGPRLRVRLVGDGQRPEDTVLLNERPFVNNTQDRIARFQDIDRIEVENLTFDGNWDRRVAQAGHLATAGYYKNQPFYAAARTGRIRRVIVRHHGAVGVVPQTRYDNPAGIEAFPLSVASIDVGQAPEAGDPRPWVVEDCEVHGFHSEFGGYTTLIMAGASSVAGRTPAWVAGDPERRVFLVRRCVVRGTPDGVGIIALGSAGCGAGESDGGRVTFSANAILNASLGFNTDCGRITCLDFTNSLFLDTWSIGNANASYSGGMSHYDVSGNALRFGHRSDYGVYRRMAYAPGRAISDPTTPLGRRQTNELIGLQIGALSNLRYTYNSFTARRPDGHGVTAAAAPFQILRKLTSADAPWVQAFADASDVDFRGNVVSSVAWDFTAPEDATAERLARFNGKGAEPLTRFRSSLPPTPRGFQPVGRVERVLPAWTSQAKEYRWKEAGSDGVPRTRSRKVEDSLLTGAIEVAIGKPTRHSDEELRIPVRLAFQPLPGHGHTRPVPGSNVWLEVSGSRAARLLSRTGPDGLAEFRIPLREPGPGRLLLRAFHDPDAPARPDAPFNEYRSAFALHQHFLGSFVTVTASPDVADEKAGQSGRLRFHRTPDAGGGLPALEVFFRLPAEGRAARIGEDFELRPVGDIELDTTVSRQNGLRRLRFPKEVDTAEVEVRPLADDDLEQEWITARLHPLPQRGYDADPTNAATVFLYDGPEWTLRNLPLRPGMRARPVAISPAFSQGTNVLVVIAGTVDPAAPGAPRTVWWQWNRLKEAPELIETLPAQWTELSPRVLTGAVRQGWPVVGGSMTSDRTPFLTGTSFDRPGSVIAASPDAAWWVALPEDGKTGVPTVGSATGGRNQLRPPGWQAIQPTGIQAAGTWVGSAVVGGSRRAFRIPGRATPDNTHLLPLPAGATESHATAIGADETVVGWVRTATGLRPCLWPAPRPNGTATVVELGKPAGLPDGIALGISSDGEVLAVAGNGDARAVPYVIHPTTGSLRPLNDPAFSWGTGPAEPAMDAVAINPQGWVIGTRGETGTPWVARRLLRR